MAPLLPKIRSALARLAPLVQATSRGGEITLWVLLAIVVVSIRVYLWRLLPTYLWSADTGSYTHSAFEWLDTGEMIFDGRRGPVFTLLIAAGLKLFGSLHGVVWLQHALSGVAILATVGAARVFFGRAALWPLMACGVALALYGVPLYLGHLLRNETTLFFFSSVALAAWWLSLRSDSKGWLFLAALAVGGGTMTKNVFVPLPLVMAAAIVLTNASSWRARGLRLALLAGGFLVPFAALQLHDAAARRVDPPQPQAGILFFGRVAQWTQLDGGIEPDLKALIRADIEDYRRRPKLDNTLIIYRTAVPHLRAELLKRGLTAKDLDRLCRRFAIEAVQAQPQAFRRQVGNDLARLHFVLGVQNDFPSDKLLKIYIDELADVKTPPPAMGLAESRAVLESRIGSQEMGLFHRCLRAAWLFQNYPVLLTTLALPLLCVLLRGRERWFFLGLAALWFFNMLLLSTVGRPLERYLMPVAPVMFWALAGCILYAWNGLLRWAEKSPASTAVASEPAAANTV